MLFVIIIRPYHSFLPDDRHPVLHAVHPVGDLGEVVFAQSLLTHGEGAVVRSRHAQIITRRKKMKKILKRNDDEHIYLVIGVQYSTVYQTYLLKRLFPSLF